MGFLKDLYQLIALPGQKPADPGQSDDLLAVEKVLSGLPQQQAHFLSCLALLLGRVAYADLEISENERSRMVKVFRDLDLDPPLAVALADLALERTRFHSLEEHLILRQLKALTQKNQRKTVMRSLLAVAAEDDVQAEENEQLRLIARALDFTQREFQELRLEFRSAIPNLRDETT